MAFVLDASATLPWCFRNEVTPETLALQRRAEAGEVLLVPSHWPIEVLNALLQAHRRSRISSEDFDGFLQSLSMFRIDSEAQPLAQHLGSVKLLADRYRLTAYDAAYLELAGRQALPLATFDKELIAAAIAEGIPLLLQSSSA